MSDLTELLARHARFVERGFVANMALSPALRATVITCVDPRVEPAAVLGLGLGDAAVLRNIGGRITNQTLLQLRLLSGLGAPATDRSRAELIVMQHTGCGIMRMAQHPEALAPYFDLRPEQLPIEEVLDPQIALRADLAVLAAQSDIAAVFTPIGLLYDLATGALERIEASEADR